MAGTANESIKRKHGETTISNQVKAPSVIDLTISDDEEQPPPKRQKSTPPLNVNGVTPGKIKASEPSRASRPLVPTTSTSFATPSGIISANSNAVTRTPSRSSTPAIKPSPSPSLKKSPFRGRPEWSHEHGSTLRNRYNPEYTEPWKYSLQLSSIASPQRAKDASNDFAKIGLLSGSESEGSLSPTGDAVRPQSREEQVQRLKNMFSPKLHTSVHRSEQSSNRLSEAKTLPWSDSSHKLSKVAAQVPARSAKPVRRSRPASPSRKLSFRPVNAPQSESRSSQIQVVIPSKKLPRSPPEDSNILAQFTGSGPGPRQVRQERQALLRDIRQSAAPIKTRLDDVERLFGHNGFSATYSTNGDALRSKKLAQKKARKVERKDVQLDLGEDPIAGNPVDPDALVHPKQQASQILESRFGKSSPALTFTNEINDRRLDGKFQFITEYILRRGVSRAKADINHGCYQCAGACDPETCSCLMKDFEDGIGLSGNPIPYSDAVVRTYIQRPDGLMILCNKYIDGLSRKCEITECNEKCGCGPSCWNRVVQKGRIIPLDIFQTTNGTGFGVRSSSRIVRGQFIDVYLGEIITQEELEAREKGKDENASSYVYSLDWWNESLNSNHFQVDGENFGTPMRFVNHSCNPNSKSFAVQTKHHEDKKVYYLAFFATRDIEPGEEITIDYNPQMVRDEDEKLKAVGGVEGDLEEDDEEEVLDEDTVLCRCGAPKCRRRLWPRASHRKRKQKRVTK